MIDFRNKKNYYRYSVFFLLDCIWIDKDKFSNNFFLFDKIS